MPDQYIQLKENIAPNIEYSPYDALSNAVIQRAALDYLDAVEKLKAKPADRRLYNTLIGNYNEVYDFFTNKKDLQLWTNADGNYLLKELNKMAYDNYRDMECQEALVRLKILNVSEDIMYQMWHPITKNESSHKSLRVVGKPYRSDSRALTDMQRDVVQQFEADKHEKNCDSLIYYCIRQKIYDIYLYIEAGSKSDWNKEQNDLKKGKAKAFFNYRDHRRVKLSHAGMFNLNTNMEI